MNKRTSRRAATGRARSIRARVLAIALIPSSVLLMIGAITATYLFQQGHNLDDVADNASAAVKPAGPFITALQEERRLTLRSMVAPAESKSTVDTARRTTDLAVGDITGAVREYADDAPSEFTAAIDGLNSSITELPALRKQADNGQKTQLEVFTFFNGIEDQAKSTVRGMARVAPDSATAAELFAALDFLQIADGMSRSNALADAAVTGGGFEPNAFQAYIAEVGSYHNRVADIRAGADEKAKSAYRAIAGSEPWRQVVEAEKALSARGVPAAAVPAPPITTALPVDPTTWQDSARTVTDALLDVHFDRLRQASSTGTEAAETTTNSTLMAVAVVGGAAVVAFLIALRLSNRLVGRLRRLREDTLDLADERLPRIIDQLRGGEQVDLDEEVAPLDHGFDEIGEVADAFNTAQHTAVCAAVQETKTREGTRSVFLNIAHRTQVIVHKQLQVLEEAQRGEDLADRPAVLSRLEHLTTRARRNADNLLLLGGEEPGQRARTPVALRAILDGAVAETEDYSRIRLDKLPTVAVSGTAVADLSHLFAELLDNASTFSPPDAGVQVGGRPVSRGVVVEIEDQGLGMDADRLDAINAMLTDAPSYSEMALPAGPRLGLFVVAQLAERHDIAVALRPSAYGGVRAIVLVPESLLADVDDTPAPSVPTEPAPAEGERMHGHAAGDRANGNDPADAVTERFPQPLVGQEFSPIPRQPTTEHRMAAPLPDRPRPGAAYEELPQRRSQRNLAPQLASAPTHPPVGKPITAESAEQSRSRLSAFQDGTQRARHGHNDRETE